MTSRGAFVSIVAIASLVCVAASSANAQGAGDCQPYALKGSVLECAAAGTPLSQLRTGTFIAGSEAAGEILARTIALEVATAPFGSSSGGLLIRFSPSDGTFVRRASTFGPMFSERAPTIGRGEFSAGINFIHREYNKLDGLPLERFDVFRFQGGTLPVTFSRLELQTRTDTLAGLASYGVSENLDVGVLVPYVKIAITGTSRIYDQSTDELQRVLLQTSAAGLGDIALFSKYRFRTARSKTAARPDLQGGLAAAVTVRMPTGDPDDLVGLGVTRTSLTLIGSTTVGRFSPHLNIGYEIWSRGVDIPRDFQGTSTITAKDQLQYSGGIVIETRNGQVSLLMDVLGQYLRGAGRVGYQPFTFPTNVANVAGAEALVAIPGGRGTLLMAPGVKWNIPGRSILKNTLLTTSVLVSVTDGGLTARVTPVVGIDRRF